MFYNLMKINKAVLKNAWHIDAVAEGGFY